MEITLNWMMQNVLKNEAVICIIPTLNEGPTVADVIKKAKHFTQHVVVVDGFSHDGTSEIAGKAGAKVIFQEGEGKGMALRTVFNKIKGDIYVTIDGDATYDALEMGKLIQPILENNADMVIGSRLQGIMEPGSISTMNIIGNRLFNLFINVLFDAQITDSQSGFRAMNKRAVDSLQLSSKGFEVETEMTIQAVKRKLRIQEVPITYVRRTGSPSKLNSIRAGASIFKTIITHALNKGES
jgi:dolichol-phosphate mannosyltransferase